MKDGDLVHELIVLENQMRGLGDREAADLIAEARGEIHQYRKWIADFVNNVVKDRAA